MNHSSLKVTPEFIASRIFAVSAIVKSAKLGDWHTGAAMTYLFSILPHVVAAGPDPVLDVVSLEDLIAFSNASRLSKDPILSHSRGPIDSFLVRLPDVDRDHRGDLVAKSSLHFSKITRLALHA